VIDFHAYAIVNDTLDSSTLTLYLVAGGFSLSLCLVLLVFAYLQPSTRMLSHFALGIFLFSVGFTVSGLGLMLPRWATVMGTNMLLLLAASVIHAGLAAFCAQRQARPDWVGLAVVALTAVPFGYWGLVEPDGHWRSAVFSLAMVAISGRTVWVLFRAAQAQPGRAPVWTLTMLFGMLMLWMAMRGLLLILADTPTPSLRGANPTTWATMFGYIVLVSLVTVGVIWLEVSQPPSSSGNTTQPDPATRGLVGFFQYRLRLLWMVVLVLLLGIIGEAGVIYAKTFEAEKIRLTHTTELATDTFARHSAQVINQVDTLLKAVRGFYLQSRALAATEAFINTLPFDKSTVDNIYFIGTQGEILISHDPAAKGLKVSDRDYFKFHQSNASDRLFIGPVESGVVTGKFHFRITRRINQPDGSFGGLFLATVVPEAFAHYYLELGSGGQISAALVGTQDHKLRARLPAPPSDRWHEQLHSPLWDLLHQSPTGVYSTASSVDAVERIYAYKQVANWPLVMVTGFSESDVRNRVLASLHWLLIGSATATTVVLLMASLLTLEIRRRDEQDRFMAMLSHELKTPLSVLRMTLGLRSRPGGVISPTVRAHAQQAVQDMDAIIERCLEVDRLQQRRWHGSRQACQPAELLSELKTASYAPQRLVLSAPDLPRIITDTQLLRVALGNLIDNALKYAAPATPVQVSASPHTHQGKSGVLFGVINTIGQAGLPDARKVFKKYYRSPGARSKTGSGLGLYLVRHIARRLGGWVRYTTDASQVQFEFWLPG